MRRMMMMMVATILMENPPPPRFPTHSRPTCDIATSARKWPFRVEAADALELQSVIQTGLSASQKGR